MACGRALGATGNGSSDAMRVLHVCTLFSLPLFCVTLQHYYCHFTDRKLGSRDLSDFLKVRPSDFRLVLFLLIDINHQGHGSLEKDFTFPGLVLPIQVTASLPGVQGSS